jgi:hypothetical protein
MYNSRVWLNKIGSPSTGNVVAFDGEVNHWKGDKIRETYLQVSDCSISARLSKTSDDTVEDFIQKMKILREEIDLFVNHLERNNR